jgi:hypothetical protein
MESLYDTLLKDGLLPSAPDPQPAFESLTGKQFAELVVNSVEFRQYIVLGIKAGDLPQAVVCRIMDHAWGQPTKHVELDDRRDFKGMTKSELQERIAMLMALAQDLPEDTNTVH